MDTITEAYEKGIKFALKMIKGLESGGDEVAEKPKDNFSLLLMNDMIGRNGSESFTDYILYIDYMMFDYIYHSYDIKKLKMKTIISAKDLFNEEPISECIKSA